MSRWKILKDPTNALYFLTLTVVEWNFTFTSLPYFELVVESLGYCQKKKELRLLGYVIMPNHLHLITSGNERYALSDTLRDFKHFTALKIIKLLEREEKSRILELFKRAASIHAKGREHKVWMDGNHPILIESVDFFLEKLSYVHDNPVRKGYVKNPEHWVFSSARNYLLGDSSVLEVEVIEY